MCVVCVCTHSALKTSLKLVCRCGIVKMQLFNGGFRRSDRCTGQSHTGIKRTAQCITNHCTSNPWCCIASSRHRRDTTGLSIQAAADSSHSPVCKETELQTHKEPSHEIYFMGPDVLNKTFFPELIKHLLPCPVKLLTSATKSSGKGSGLNWI